LMTSAMKLTPVGLLCRQDPGLAGLHLSTFGVMRAGLLFESCIGAPGRNLSGCSHIAAN
jgi:hypothetical protein